MKVVETIILQRRDPNGSQKEYRKSARTAERQTPGEIVGRLINLSLGLFMVLGTCTLL